MRCGPRCGSPGSRGLTPSSTRCGPGSSARSRASTSSSGSPSATPNRRRSSGFSDGRSRLDVGRRSRADDRDQGGLAGRGDAGLSRARRRARRDAEELHHRDRRQRARCCALTGEINGLRVGLLRPFFMDGSAPEVTAAVQSAARALEGLGAVVDEVRLESVWPVAAASFAIVASEALAYHAEWMRTRSADYQPDVRERLKMGAFVTGVQYVRAQQVRARVRAEVDEALARRDVLLAPTTPLPAPVLGQTETRIGDAKTDVRSALIRLTRPFNFSGHPACSLPCGVSGDGLPIGMQLVGRPFDEATVLRVADAYQRATDWHRRDRK